MLANPIPERGNTHKHMFVVAGVTDEAPVAVCHARDDAEEFTKLIPGTHVVEVPVVKFLTQREQ